ncbi:angiopoietin-related protein 4 [Paramormyrops kingsleyae]|uniref:Angiopoietin-like 4 n=1 Tax=Paramormyrops kingsleyae TaxID=1676925 RepID=A0A3B3S4F7_9TELE|nr:angiopoietin-related protein 4 [Paramormyrops kingsleyae]
MRSTMVVPLLCLVFLAHVGLGYVPDRKGATGKERKVQYASWDDVNVIAHGLLQLGHGLKEHVDKTKGQIRDISSKLKVFNSTVAELGKQTQSLKEDGEVLKLKAQQLQVQQSQVLNISNELWEKTEELQRERLQVHERIGKLEQKVYGILHGDVSNSSDSGLIQLMLEAQNRRIDDLIEEIRQQQERLEKQNARIKNLQSQIKQRKERSYLRREETAVNGSREQSDSPTEAATDCHKLFLSGKRTSGIYTIQPLNSQPFHVFCEMTDEGGWTVMQRRHDGSLDFDQLWQAYEEGFGSPSGDFWLGLQKMHALSVQGEYIMQVELSNWKDETESVKYLFSLGGEESDYTLHLKDVSSGSLASALASNPSGLPFSTRDRDNDQRTDINCAKHLSGGWWFSNCGRSNLNGKYFNNPLPKQRHQRKQAVFWKTQRGRYYPWKTTAMKIAPIEIEKQS